VHAACNSIADRLTDRSTWRYTEWFKLLLPLLCYRLGCTAANAGLLLWYYYVQIYLVVRWVLLLAVLYTCEILHAGKVGWIGGWMR
jgi:uncharacterized membrane protein YoaK (UPF0700 family)